MSEVSITAAAVGRTGYVTSSKGSATQSAEPPDMVSSATADTLTIGSGNTPVNVTYTSTGEYTNNSGAVSATLSASDAISATADGTDEEKWNFIVSKYNISSTNSMNVDNYLDMLCDLTNMHLISFDEMAQAAGNALGKIDNERAVADMQDGILGNLPMSAINESVNFSELLKNVSDGSKEYYGYDSNNDQRSFLEGFYSKMVEYEK